MNLETRFDVTKEARKFLETKLAELANRDRVRRRTGHDLVVLAAIVTGYLRPLRGDLE